MLKAEHHASPKMSASVDDVTYYLFSRQMQLKKNLEN